jgi:hypothetical protein
MKHISKQIEDFVEDLPWKDDYYLGSHVAPKHGKTLGANRDSKKQ